MIAINKFSLDNGLKVVHVENKNVSMVIVNTLYNVGSKDEKREKTGFAHLFEHLMFGGTPNVPNYDEPVQKAGGENNAWTSNDYTNYYVALPANNAEVGFWLESDRMRGLSFTQKSLDVQRHVVCEEFKQRCLNQPYGDLYHLIRKMCFEPSHSYSWPTIGLALEHIEQATLEDVKSFFYTHYAPNNAILCVVGNISLEETKRLTQKWYGSIPVREIAPRIIPNVPVQTKPQFMEVERDVPATMIFKTYHTAKRMASDFFVSDLVSDVLGNGASSRLKQRLVKDRRIFTDASASVSGDIEAGLFHINGTFTEQTTFEQANHAFDDTIEELKTQLIPEYELEKLKNKYEANQLACNMVVLDLASDLAYYELLGDANMINTEIENYRSVTSEEVRSYAQRTFTEENCSTLYYKKK